MATVYGYNVGGTRTFLPLNFKNKFPKNKNFWPSKKIFRIPFGIILLLLFSFTERVYGQTAVVTTDRMDYPPGDTVLINGSGFLPGESVTLQVLVTDSINDNATSPAHQPWQVIADTLGDFISSWIVPLNGDELGANLKLTADGQTSLLHAEVLFKDGSACILSAISGVSSRCRGAGTNIYGATSPGAQDWLWTVTGAGNIISPVNGIVNTTVTWSPTFSGIAVITVSVTGCNGQTTKSFSVTVTAPPAIITQPASQTICVGNAVTFSVTASDAASYQWKKDGVDIFHATSASYKINSISTADAGTYKVVITNSCGTVTSSDAILTLNTSPTISCPANITTNTPPGLCNAVVSYSFGSTGIPSPSITYLFAGATTGSGSGSGTGSTFNAVTTKVTLTATNLCAASNCSFSITVTDNEKPVITAPANINVNNDAGACGSSIAIVPATATDNCSVGAVTGTRSDALALNALYPVGTTTITWTVSDNHGNAALPKTQTITVTDNEKPVITAAANINANNDAGVCGALVTIVNATATDNCSAGAVTGTRSDALALNALYPVGTTTITWTVSDINGNAALSKAQTITVTDNELPVITAAADIAQTADAGKCGATITIADATATDNCSVGAVTGTRSDALALSALYPVGTTTITWTVSDVHGNAALPKTQIITVTDNELPVITAAADIAQTADAGKCGATVTIVAATVTDNCTAGATTGTRSDTLALNALYPVGTTTITWNITDIHSNAAIAKTQIITVTDNEKPVITTAADITQTADAGICGAAVTIVNATATDNCSVDAVTGTRSDALALNALYPVGTTTITWTVSDIHGNAALPKTQTITVTDNELPVITAAADIAQTADAGKCGATVTIVAATATDNCSVGAVTGTRSDASALNALYPVGTTMITWTVSDIHGNAAIAKTQTVTVTDNEGPVITPTADIAQTADAGKCGATVTIINATATDNCIVGTPTGTRSDTLALNALYPVGTTIITWNVSDIHGNVAVAKTQTITITDNELPVTTAPSGITQTADAGICGATVTIVNATATDNCSVGTPTGTRSDTLALNALYPVGTTTITWNVTDIHSNSAIAKTQTVVVTDNEKPVITAPAGITQTADASKCGATVTITNATATDNCSVGIPTGTRSDALALNALYPVGTTTITWNATDIHGNAALAKTQTVTVTDDELPVITASSNINANNNAGVCGALVTIVNATATDNCSVGAVTGTRSDALALNALYPVGTTTITWTVSDIHANAALSKTQTITVTDNEKPTISCPSNITVNYDPAICGASIAINNPTINDNCSVKCLKWVMTGATTYSSTTAGINYLGTQTFNLGITAITYTVKDPAGNFNTCTFSVTVNPDPVTAAVSVTPNTQQYSDSVTFFTRIVGGYSSCTAPAAATVTFKVGTQIMGTVPLVQDGADLIATLANVQLMEPSPFGTAPTGQMAPGTHTVTACFNTVNTTNFILSNATTSLTITPENDPIIFSGLPYFSTTSSTSCVANIILSATLIDTTDRKRGDIRNSLATFHNGSIAGTCLGTANLQPALINSADPTSGIVSTAFTYSLSQTDCSNKGTSLVVYANVTKYYTGNNALDPAIVTICVPGSDAVTGGGYLINTNSTGTYAGTPGAHTNFGFTMKYTKNGVSAKGQCNIIIRSNRKIYQIKSNAITNLTAIGKYGNFCTKATLTDITNPSSPGNSIGNLDLVVEMYDSTKGGQNDKISISLTSNNGATNWYSSGIYGSGKVPMRTLDGGNINVKNASSPLARMTEVIDTLQNTQSALLLYPNPTTGLFTLEIHRHDVTENANITVMNSFGQLVYTKIPAIAENLIKETIELDASLPSGIYLLQIRIDGKIETTRIVLTK